MLHLIAEPRFFETQEVKDEESNVLVTTCGTIVAQGIMKSLRLANKDPKSKIRYRIFTTDMSAEAAGLYRSDAGFLVPPISSPSYIESIIKICNSEKIRMVYVGADEELQVMADSKEEIERRTGAIVVTNPSNVISTCTDKWQTFQFLSKNNLPCPVSALPEDQESFASQYGFPAIVKPREGHGSLHIYVANDREEMRQSISAIQKYGWRPFIQQLIPTEKEEFTVGVTVNPRKNSIMSSIAMRRILHSGQTYKAFIDDYPEVRKTAEEVALKLGAKGPVNLQGRVHEGKFKIFEINPRFSASTPIRAVAGVNEADIIFRNLVLHEDVNVDSYQQLACMRYWNEVYVPMHSFSKTVEQRKIADSDSFIPDYF